MAKEQNVYEIAQALTSEKVLTFYDVCEVLLKDINCIICNESAADLLGYSNLGYIKKIHIYTLQKINKPYLVCHLVDNLDSIPYNNHKKIKVSPIEVALVDMLNDENSDSQVLYESFATYYCSNHNSYKNLVVPRTLAKKAHHYMEEGKLFYEK